MRGIYLGEYVCVIDYINDWNQDSFHKIVAGNVYDIYKNNDNYIGQYDYIYKGNWVLTSINVEVFENHFAERSVYRTSQINKLLE